MQIYVFWLEFSNRWFCSLHEHLKFFSNSIAMSHHANGRLAPKKCLAIDEFCIIEFILIQSKSSSTYGLTEGNMYNYYYVVTTIPYDKLLLIYLSLQNISSCLNLFSSLVFFFSFQFTHIQHFCCFFFCIFHISVATNTRCIYKRKRFKKKYHFKILKFVVCASLHYVCV